MTRTRVRRRRVAATGVAMLLAGTLIGPVSHALAGPAMEPAGDRTYVVHRGDTLWRIATRIAPGKDPRSVVRAIADQNAVEPGALIPGQTLVIPSLG